MSCQNPIGPWEPGKAAPTPTMAMRGRPLDSPCRSIAGACCLPRLWTVTGRPPLISTARSRTVGWVFGKIMIQHKLLQRTWPEMKGRCRHWNARTAQLLRTRDHGSALEQIARDLNDRAVAERFQK